MAGWTMTFVIRLTSDDLGRVTGVVERVKTGLKTRVEGLDAVGRAIGEMIVSPGLTTSRTRLRQEACDDAKEDRVQS
jgi:hypothetical protein